MESPRVMFESQEQRAFKLISPALSLVCTANWLSFERVRLVERRQFYYVHFGDAVVMRLANRPLPRVWINDGRGGFFERALPSLEQIRSLEAEITQALQRVIDGMPTEFSSCQLSDTCRAAGCCMSPSDETAGKCRLRKSLHGRCENA